MTPGLRSCARNQLVSENATRPYLGGYGRVAFVVARGEGFLRLDQMSGKRE
jgi:hypothetical protein